MKLSKWAEQQGITYRTAWSWFHDNQIPNAYQAETGTIIVNEHAAIEPTKRVVVYCRVSSQSRKHELNYQVTRCTDFCETKGLTVSKIFKEVASGMNDKRREFFKMIEYAPTTIVVENKDRLTRFGFNYLKVLLKKLNCEIVVMNEDHEDERDLIKDMIAVVTSFCCRLYGLRRGQNKAKQVKSIVSQAK